MNPSLSAIRGFPARGRISARIRRPRPAPSPPITPSSGRGGRRDEQGPVPLLRPAGPHVRRDPADLQPGGTEDHRRWPFPLQRRDVVFSDHVYLRRCLHRSLWIWRFAARHLDRILRGVIAGGHGNDHGVAAARARMGWPGGLRAGLQLRAADHRFQPGRLLVRRVRQLLRDGENEASDQGALPVDPHGRLDGGRPGGGYIRGDGAHVWRQLERRADRQPDPLRLSGEGAVWGGRHAGDLLDREFTEAAGRSGRVRYEYGFQPVSWGGVISLTWLSIYM